MHAFTFENGSVVFQNRMIIVHNPGIYMQNFTFKWGVPPQHRLTLSGQGAMRLEQLELLLQMHEYNGNLTRFCKLS